MSPFKKIPFEAKCLVIARLLAFALPLTPARTPQFPPSDSFGSPWIHCLYPSPTAEEQLLNCAWDFCHSLFYIKYTGETVQIMSQLFLKQ